MPTPVQPDFGVVILTMGKRRKRLVMAIESVLKQRDVTTDILVVGNGWDPASFEALPPQARTLALPENLGIPAGRNAGIGHVTGDLVFFLDDDAEVVDDDFLSEVKERFEDDPGLGALQGRVFDPKGKGSPSRWVPKLGSGEVEKPFAAFSLWEGAVAIRRDVLLAAGRWPGDFFYAHEGIELAWRVWEQRKKVIYDPDLRIYHPVKKPTRHADYYRLSARNRVWVARRNLPAPLSVVYATSWAVLQVLRSLRSPRGLRPWFGGFREGWRECPRDQRKMSWGTVAYIARKGRLLVV
ncbi:glycosyltransferase family 2 protein [Demequina litorisediminis]|uniref:Glycosyl transferase n=1 Tax=Demequina litorisediminis TaxID=1849022 RepID=A0ABQ6IER8_9MICO|nr:glycosyltransferase [Demequina litorisediminis]GMA36387.1 glycosyl transferase [Demequina litorisediminis]